MFRRIILISLYHIFNELKANQTEYSVALFPSINRTSYIADVKYRLNLFASVFGRTI